MGDYLVDHALKNVWCSPYQDYQVRFQPIKVSQVGGDQYYVNLMHQRIMLPNNTDRFYVYQIGQVHPALYNLFTEQRRWFALSKIMRTNNIMINVYTDSGYEYPRFETYMCVTDNQNLIFAVKAQPMIKESLTDHDLFFRFYSNAYFASEREQGNVKKIYCYGKTIMNNVDMVNAQNLYSQHQALPGSTYAVINGVFNTVLNLNTMQIGDVVEFVYDSTVKTIVEFPVTDLQTFQSILDNGAEKYLLHSTDLVTDTIEYHDDIDFYLYRPMAGGNKKGVLMNRNRKDCVRMVTHKDYAVPSAILDTQVAAVDFFDNISQLTIRLHIRHSGYHRPLVDEHHRIKELYKLSEDQIVEAFMGVNSLVPEWKAEELENSDYTRIMRRYGSQIDLPLVTDAYGYNAISNLVGKSPLPVQIDGGSKMIDLPVAFNDGCTVYEYSTAGVLLGFYSHSGGSYYPVRNATTAFGEICVGIGSRTLGMDIGKNISAKVTGTGYRFYTANKIDGVVTGNYTDVTGTDKYTEGLNQFIWSVNHSLVETIVRRDDRFLAYSVNLAGTDDLLRFSIDSQEFINNVNLTRVVKIPTARLDLWLNGRALIEGVDFHVRWPQVCIINKTHRKPIGPQTVTVRAYGFPDSDLQREKPAEWGFVKYGVLSRNTRFDIRDDKVMRFVANGYVKQRSAIKFQEDTQALVVNDALNGKPYLVWDQIVPIRNFANADTYTLRAISLEVDGRISDYLTLKRPEPVPESPSVIPSLYPVVSPFCAKVISDLRNGIINPDFVESVYSSQDLVEYLEPYTELLDFDPTQPNTLYDSENCIVHPHGSVSTIQVTLFQWQFIKKVVEVFLYNRIDLTTHITVEVL